MNRPAVPPLVAALFVLGSYAGFELVEGKGNVVLPPHGIHELPLTLGIWDGKDEELKEDFFRATGAESAVDRLYRDGQRHVISLHMALFSEYERILPHHPRICYPANGFSITQDERTEVHGPGEKTFPATLLTCENPEGPIKILCWYQLGDRVLLNRHDIWRASRQMWGRDVWPPLIKVHLQTAAFDRAAAEARLRDVARRVAAWLDGHMRIPEPKTTS